MAITSATTGIARPGRFGPYGGQFVPETLMPALAELIAAYDEARQDPTFAATYDALARDFIGRPTPLYHAATLCAQIGGAQLYFKREDLAHTGAHKINNALGQGLLARRMRTTTSVGPPAARPTTIRTAFPGKT